MVIKRNLADRLDKGDTSRPYRIDGPRRSLSDRIGKPWVKTYGARPQTPYSSTIRSEEQAASLKDNPLFHYLHGRKPSRPAQSIEKDSTYGNVTKSAPEASQGVGANRLRSEDIRIRGSGQASNAFSFRGASSTSVSIKNLAPGTNQADVCTILNEQIGEVEACTTFPVQGGLSTTAEVRFGSRIAADKAINILHGVLADNKRLDVSILLSPDQPSHVAPAQIMETTATQATANTIDRPDRKAAPASQPARILDKRDLFAHRALDQTGGNNRAEQRRRTLH